MKAWIDLIIKRIDTPTDVASVVLLRIVFGLLMFWEMSRYFYHNWIEELYIRQQFHFKYEWFTWIKPLSGDLMYLVFITLCICSIMIALGWFYRLTITVFCGLYLYVFLIDHAYYNNHFYVIVIISFLMIFLHLSQLYFAFSKSDSNFLCSSA